MLNEGFIKSLYEQSTGSKLATVTVLDIINSAFIIHLFGIFYVLLFLK